jgi:hypothetical protein
MAIGPKRSHANVPLPGFPETASTQPDAPPVRPSGASPYRLTSHTPRRVFTVRLMRPLIVHYHDLVRELERDGYATSVTELVHALLHAGPATKAQARALLRDWRRQLDADPRPHGHGRHLYAQLRIRRD